MSKNKILIFFSLLLVSCHTTPSTSSSHSSHGTLLDSSYNPFSSSEESSESSSSSMGVCYDILGTYNGTDNLGTDMVIEITEDGNLVLSSETSNEGIKVNLSFTFESKKDGYYYFTGKYTLEVYDFTHSRLSVTLDEGNYIEEGLFVENVEFFK